MQLLLLVLHVALLLCAAAAGGFTWKDVTHKKSSTNALSRRSLAAAGSTSFVRRATSATSFVFELQHNNQVRFTRAKVHIFTCTIRIDPIFRHAVDPVPRR